MNLLLFQVGARRFGADAAEVKRVERSRPGDGRLSTLGSLSSGMRALVFDVEGSERRLQVDEVLGLALVEVDALRRIPQGASPRPYAVGLWLDEEPVLLLELSKTVQDLEARH